MGLTKSAEPTIINPYKTLCRATSTGFIMTFEEKWST